MMEIAISLAVIGIALVAIIGVLPRGMTTQQDNRERTIINQDETVIMEDIRNGASGGDDLTNYVYQVEVTNSYYSNFNGNAEIIGLLSTPGVTNHAWVYSISGPAVEKPPQDNPTVIGSSFNYKIACENIPIPTADNSPFNKQLTNNLHELRLTFYWPLLPNGNLSPQPFSQTFRALVAGQLEAGTNGLYFFQPDSFTNAP